MMQPWRFLILVVLVGSASCASRVVLTQGPDFRVYQPGKIRIYVAEAFQHGFIGMDSEADYTAFYQRTVSEIGVLFKRRVLTGEMFLAAVGGEWPEVGVIQLHQRNLTQVDELLAVDPGPLIKLLYYQDISDPADASHRKYDLWITFSRSETGWGEFYHFTILLENNDPSTWSSGTLFSRTATVKALTYDGLEI